MAIGTSLGAFYKDELHQHLNKYLDKEPVPDNNEESPDSLKDKKEFSPEYYRVEDHYEPEEKPVIDVRLKGSDELPDYAMTHHSDNIEDRRDNSRVSEYLSYTGNSIARNWEDFKTMAQHPMTPWKDLVPHPTVPPANNLSDDLGTLKLDNDLLYAEGMKRAGLKPTLSNTTPPETAGSNRQDNPFPVP